MTTRPYFRRAVRLARIGCVYTLGVVTIIGSAATPQKVWTKYGATEDSFAQDRYQCFREARTPYSSTYVNTYAGASSSGTRIDEGMFGACMEARGWRLVDKPK
jgi:hypothetical protein